MQIRVELKLPGTDIHGKEFMENTFTENVSVSAFLCACTATLAKDSIVEVYIVKGSDKPVGKARVVRSEERSGNLSALWLPLYREDRRVDSEVVGYRQRAFNMAVTHQSVAPEKTANAAALGSPLTSIHAVRVLIVDDDLALRTILSVMLTQSAFLCHTAASGEEALRLLEAHPTDVVISDLRMPGISGMDLLIEVRERYPHLAFLMVTGEDETRVGVRAMQLGADDYLLKPFDADVVLGSLHRALQKKKLEREVQEYRLHLEEMVSERTQQLRTALQQTERSYEDTLEALGAAIDLRDSPTAGHSRRVFLYSMELAKSIGGLGQEIRSIAMGAWLHDIGKLAIPDRVLLKPGPLTDSEWEIMRRHARIGYELVKSISFLAGAAEIVLTHHERFDGSGYPQKMKGGRNPVRRQNICCRGYAGRHDFRSALSRCSPAAGGARCHRARFRDSI